MNLKLFFLNVLHSCNFFLIIFILSGCGFKSKLKKNELSNTAQLQEVVDRITSLPDPLQGFTLVDIRYDVNQGGNIQIVYKPVKLHKQMLAEFSDATFRLYEMSMETLGWDLMHQMRMKNSWILLFNRPDKTLCQINFDSDISLTVTLLYDDSKKDL